jgi:hypothetical protein
MATNPFEGLGLQFMGKERQHMTGGPFSDLGKMIAPAAMAYGLYKSGAIDDINKAFNPKEALMGYLKGNAQPVVPPQMGKTENDMLANENIRGGLTPDMVNLQNNVGVPPTEAPPVQTDVVQFDAPSYAKQVIPSQYAGITADTFKRDVSQDMAALQTTQAQAQPPSNVGQGQMNKAPKSDGGANMAAIIKLLMSFA